MTKDTKNTKTAAAATTTSASKPKKQWQPTKRFSLTKEQKIILGLLIILIPLIVFILIPIIARQHFTKHLNIPSEIFLSTPQKISLLDNPVLGTPYNVNINGYEFPIPEDFTPARIGPNHIELRKTHRADTRRIYITANPATQPLKYTKLGISRWFLPKNTFKFMQLILNSTWHPIRLMFKAQYYTIEGLNSKIYECNFDNNYCGFVYPSAGQEGYMTRAFSKDGSGYFDYHIKDSVEPPTLNEWLHHTSKIKPLAKTESNKADESGLNLHSLIKQAKDRNNENAVLSASLSEYFRTKTPEWLIPVLEILSNREYYPDLIAMHQNFNKHFEQNPELAALWDNVMDKAIDKILKVDFDVYETAKEMTIFYKNLSNLEIDRLEFEFSVVDYYGQISKFKTAVVKAGRVLPQAEKNTTIKIPADVRVRGAKQITHKVTKLLFAE